MIYNLRFEILMVRLWSANQLSEVRTSHHHAALHRWFPVLSLRLWSANQLSEVRTGNAEPPSVGVHRWFPVLSLRLNQLSEVSTGNAEPSSCGSSPLVSRPFAAFVVGKPTFRSELSHHRKRLETDTQRSYQANEDPACRSRLTLPLFSLHHHLEGRLLQWIASSQRGEAETDRVGPRWSGTTVGYLQSIVALDLRGGGAERTGGG